MDFLGVAKYCTVVTCTKIMDVPRRDRSYVASCGVATGAEARTEKHEIPLFNAVSRLLSHVRVKCRKICKFCRAYVRE